MKELSYVLKSHPVRTFEAEHDWSFDGRPLVTKMENKYPFTYDTLAHLLLELLHCRFIVVCKLLSPQDYEVIP